MELKIIRGSLNKANLSEDLQKCKSIDLLSIQKVNLLVGRESGLNCSGIIALSQIARKEGLI